MRTRYLLSILRVDRSSRPMRMAAKSIGWSRCKVDTIRLIRSWQKTCNGSKRLSLSELSDMFQNYLSLVSVINGCIGNGKRNPRFRDTPQCISHKDCMMGFQEQRAPNLR